MKASPLFPLSRSQRSRWFMYRLSPSEQGRYNTVFAARIEGEVLVAQLSDAFEILARRHPMLRARFVERDGEPMQYVDSIAQIPLTSVDADGLEGEALRARVERDAAQAFDLSRSPPIRAHLYRIEPRRCVLLLSLDHMASDGWSYWRLLGELGRLLSGMELAPLAGLNYKDHVLHQTAWLGSSAAQRQLAYWTRALEGDLPLLDLSFARRDNAGAPDYRSVRADLTPSQVSRLRAFCARNAVTPFVFLLTAYQIALHRFNGQADIVVGCPMPARGDGQWDDVIGDFVNVVPMRAHLSADADIMSVLRDGRRTALHAISHQDYPFPELVRTLRLSRTDCHPVFQTMFVFQKARGDDELHALWHSEQSKVPRIRWGELELSPFETRQHVGVPGIDLSLQSIEVGDVIRCDIGFDGGRLDGNAVARFAGAFRMLVDSMLQAPPDAGVDTLPLLHDLERRTVIETFNATSTPWRPGLLHARFEAQAAASPDAVALEYAQERLTYAQLNARANRVARRLRAEGVGPDALVAICVPRSIEMVVGLLAVLKAGGAYVPLDPAYPHERLVYVLEDSAPLLLLTVHSLHSLLPVTPVPVLWLDDAAEWAELPSQDPLPQELAPEHLAYVIYTSGSTGRPKGVMVTHANVSSMIHMHVGTCALGANDRALQFSTFAFDASVEEIFGPLSVGATLVLLPPDMMSYADARFSEYLHQQRITFASLPTVFWNHWAGNPDFAGSLQGADLKFVFIGGEKQDRQSLDAWLSGIRGSDIRLLDAYGPTEATVYVSANEYGPDFEGTQTLGRPLANSRIYIVDRHDQPAPIGVRGELLIGGAQVARGYLGRPDLTAERFVADPFVPGGRVYRTGDLGRWRADGTIEYLGRNDFQVKIRGFRIELGEIEAQLSACTGVREAVVVVREDMPGHRRLVGYLSAQPGAELSAATIRETVTKRLADYMVPSALVVMPALPLTPNGKLDRGALPVPGHESMATRAYAAPSSVSEQSLAHIWSALLGIEQVGREDHFFELGGTSLLLVRLGFQIKETFGVELRVAQIYEASTLKDMAALLDAATARARERTQAKTVTLDL